MCGRCGPSPIVPTPKGSGHLWSFDLAENGGGGGGFIEDIEMEAGDAGVDEVLDLAGGPADADGELPVGVVALAELGDEGVGQTGFAERSDPLDLREAGDGENAGNDGHSDVELAAALAEAKEVGVVVEELGDDAV